MYKIPILIIAYNRPEHVRRILKDLEIIRPSKLYLSVDGAATSENLELTRKCIEAVSSINWTCNIILNINPRNYGGSLGPSRAISWFFEHEEFGIILEDDISPRVEFFEFVEHCEIEYRNDPRVGAISGNNFTKKEDNFWSGKVGLSKLWFGWGWATWRKNWNGFNPEGHNLAKFMLEGSSLSETLYNDQLLIEKYRKIFIDWRGGNSWDFMWQFHLWNAGLWCLIPPVNLCGNLGVGEDSTNIKGVMPWMLNWSKNWNDDLATGWSEGIVHSEIGDKFNAYVLLLGLPSSVIEYDPKNGFSILNK